MGTLLFFAKDCHISCWASGPKNRSVPIYTGLIASLIFLLAVPQRAAAYGFWKKSTRWKGTGRVEFVVNMTNAPPAFTEKQILEFVRRGLEVWNQIETSRLTFTLGRPIHDPAKNSAEADDMNVIFWQELSGRRTDNVAGRAHAFATDCDIQLLPMSPYTLLDVQAIVMHELGHCMGLAHSAAAGSATILGRTSGWWSSSSDPPFASRGRLCP